MTAAERCTKKRPAAFCFVTTGHMCHKLEESDLSNREQRSDKESKKQPLRTANEKKAVNYVKKHAGDRSPLIAKKP